MPFWSGQGSQQGDDRTPSHGARTPPDSKWVDALGAFRSALDHAVAGGRMSKAESAQAWKWARTASTKDIDTWRNKLGQQELAAAIP